MDHKQALIEADKGRSQAARDNEAGLLGAIMRNPAAFPALAEIVKASDFSWHSYGYVWDAMLSLHKQGLTIDTITVGDELERKNRIAEVSNDSGVMMRGRSALSWIRDEGNPKAVESYAQKVLEYSASRQLLELMNMGAQWYYNGRGVNDMVSDLQKRMDAIRTFDHKSAQHTQTLGEAVSDAYDMTDAAASGKIVSVPTGYIDLDKMLGGLMAPDLYVIAARPGQGKTALLASIAKNAAEKGKKVAIFSLEMQNKQIAMRLIAMESGVGYDKQKTGNMTEEDWTAYTKAVEVLADAEKFPIVLNDMPSISIPRMRQELRRMKDIDLLIMDYIQLGGVEEKYDRRDQEIGEITAGLKALAKEFQVPVLAAAQLSRAVESRSDKRPVLSDLRESGSIENDADVVMFIYRPDQYEKDTDKQNTAEVIVAKHRNGPVGTVNLIYRPSRTRFENATTKIFKPNAVEAHYETN